MCKSFVKAVAYLSPSSHGSFNFAQGKYSGFVLRHIHLGNSAARWRSGRA